MAEPAQEIKARLSIEDVVSPYVQLKKAGKYLKGLCPFHDEKTASFFVSPDRQIAYCFSCQKGGDHFAFIEEIEGLDFRGALELLAEKANYDLPKSSHSSGKSKSVSKDEKQELKSIFSHSAAVFSEQLFYSYEGSEAKNLSRSLSAEKVRQYLESRGLLDQTITFFQVGFAPESKDFLYRQLLEKKHSKEDLLASTMVVARDSELKNVEDRFHLRLMVPIDSPQGDVIAFGGRALKKGDQPKYLNSPEHPLYNKSSVLYNMGRAKQSVREEDAVVVVEGYFDVMMSHQAGVKNVVANCGTALTEKQFKLIKRYTKNVLLALDSDSAGQAALLRAIEIAQPMDLNLYVVELNPDGSSVKDAADAVKEDPKIWLDAIKNKKRYLDHFLDKWSTENDLSTSEGKREFTDLYIALLKGVTHPVDLDHYLKELSKKVGTPVDRLYSFLKQIQSLDAKRNSAYKKQEEILVTKKLSRKEKLIRAFLGLIAAFPQQFFDRFKEWEDPEFFLGVAQKLHMIKPMFRFDPEGFKTFYDKFENAFKSQSEELDASSVYKQIRDHYNQHAELKEGFYASFPEGSQLHVWENIDLSSCFSSLETLLDFPEE